MEARRPNHAARISTGHVLPEGKSRRARTASQRASEAIVIETRAAVDEIWLSDASDAGHARHENQQLLVLDAFS